MMNNLSFYANLIPELEEKELENSFHENVSPQVYGQLLALYLLFNKTHDARILWKRIPDAVKVSNPEVVQIWKVGAALVRRDWVAIYGLIDEFEWPVYLKNITTSIKDQTRTRTCRLFEKAYSTIRLNQLGTVLGLNEQELLERLESTDWTLSGEDNMVVPTEQASAGGKPSASFEEIIAQLTDLVSFMEK